MADYLIAGVRLSRSAVLLTRNRRHVCCPALPRPSVVEGRVAYRDGLEAAHSRIAALEGELADARSALEERSEKNRGGSEPGRHKPRQPQGKMIYYDSPETYLPLAALTMGAVSETAGWLGTGFRVDRPSSNSVLVWAAYRGLAVPCALFIRLLLWFLLVTVLLPWSAILFVVGSPLLFPAIVLSRFKFGGVDAPSRQSWLTGHVSASAAGSYTLFLVTTLWMFASVGVPILVGSLITDSGATHSMADFP